MEVGKMPAQRKTKQSRGLTAAGLIAVTAATLLMMAWAIFPTPALATHVDPVEFAGNPTCSTLAPGTTELKVDPVADGTYSDGTLTVTIDVGDTPDGQVFDFTSNIGLDAVFAKGADAGNLYKYDPPGPEATADTGLHAPVNASGKFAGLSHISFCYDADVTPNLGITKSATSTQVSEGGAVSYTITVTNTGNGNATGVVVTDNLDDALTGVSATFDGPGANDGNCTVGVGNQITCTIGPLGAGQSATVTINATAPQLPLTEGGQCTLQLLNQATVDSDQTAPKTSNQVTVTVTGTGCESGGGGGGGGGGTTTTAPPASTTPPIVAPTTVHNTSTSTTAEVLPTTVRPGKLAFTGIEDVVPIGTLALTLMTTGSGLLWAGSRRRRHDGSEDEDNRP
jgi:uncharacterized repeat protein (TIGR01451 family)